jgi:hypothetical protein
MCKDHQDKMAVRFIWTKEGPGHVEIVDYH